MLYLILIHLTQS